MAIIGGVSASLVQYIYGGDLRSVEDVLFASLVTSLTVLRSVLTLFFPTLSLFSASSQVFIGQGVRLLSRLQVFKFGRRQVVLYVILAKLYAVMSGVASVLVARRILVLLAKNVLLLNGSTSLQVRVVSIFIISLGRPYRIISAYSRLYASLGLIFRSRSLGGLLKTSLGTIARTCNASLYGALRVTNGRYREIKMIRRRDIQTSFFRVPNGLFRSQGNAGYARSSTSSRNVYSDLFGTMFLQSLGIYGYT